MDNQRTIIWALFAAMVFLTWSQWQQTFAPQPLPESETIVVAPAEPADNAAPTLESDTPVIATDSTDPAVPQAPRQAAEKIVRVATDLLDISISTKGATLVEANLTAYPVSKDRPDEPVRLLNFAPGNEYTIATGLVDSASDGPTHLTALAAKQDSYVLADGQGELVVPFSWTNAAGVEVTKTYRFTRGRYDIDVEYQIVNNSAEAWRALSYQQIRRDHNPAERSMFNVDTYSFFGPVVYDGEKYEKLDPEDLADDPLNLTVAGGWIASIEHHFLTAAVPPADDEYAYDAKYSNNVVYAARHRADDDNRARGIAHR